MGRRTHRDRLADGGPRHAGGVDVAEHDPTRSGRLARGPRVDGECLQPELRGVADHRRRARRPLRAPGLLRDRVGPVRRGVGCGRAGAQRRLPRRGPGSPGGRRGSGADAWFDPADRRLPAREARSGDRHVQRGNRDRRRARPAGRRRDRRGHRLDVDLLAQRPDRPGRDPARPQEDRGELRWRHRPRHSRPVADQRGRASGSSGAWCAETPSVGAASRSSERLRPEQRWWWRSSPGSCGRRSRWCRCASSVPALSQRATGRSSSPSPRCSAPSSSSRRCCRRRSATGRSMRA